MADSDYEVQARLELNAPAALRSLNTLSGRLRSLGATIRGTNSGFGRLVGGALAFGSTYVGINAAAGALRSVATASFGANANIETLRLSIAAVYGAVEGQELPRAMEEVGGIFERLNILATETPATAADLIGIFKDIYGPLRVAGQSMEQLETLTKNTSAASLALGISNEVAASSISRMAQGAAGMENPLFRSLRSMRLITESTQEFNALNPAERAERIQAAMQAIGGASAAEFGRTWVGVSSTFGGLMERFAQIFGSTTFERIRNMLGAVNDKIGEYRVNIERVLVMLGDRFGAVMSGVLDGMWDAFGTAFNNLDAIAAKFDQIWAKFNELRPVLIDAAKMFAQFQAARMVLGPVIGGIGSLIGMVTTIASFFGVGGAASAAAAGAGGAAAAGAAGAGGAAAAGAAGAAGAGTAAAGVAGAAGGGALAAIAAPFLALAAVVAGLVSGFNRFKSVLNPAIEATAKIFVGIGGDLMDIIASIWAFIEPPLAFLGGVVIAAVVFVFRILAGVVRVLLVVFKGLGRIIRWIGDNILAPFFQALGEVFAHIFDMFGKLGSALSKLADWLFDFVDDNDDEVEAPATGSRPATNFLDELRDAWRGGDESAEEAATGTEAGAPGARGGTNVDMRGSRITVQQEFRDADPDRVWIQMRDALEREAVQRTNSGYASALTR